MTDYNLFLIGLLALLAIAFVVKAKSLKNIASETDGGLISLADFVQVVGALEKTGEEGAFAVVLVPNSRMSDGFDANLQFSKVNGKVLIEWVLVAKRNIADQSNVVNFFKNQGVEPVFLEMNDVAYIQFPNVSNTTHSAQQILKELYGLNETAQLPLIITGFDWHNK